MGRWWRVLYVAPGGRTFTHTFDGKKSVILSEAKDPEPPAGDVSLAR
jgi:hypothetical protein